MSLYLFDIDGHPIAFCRTWDDECVFAVDGSFVGFRPWKGSDVVDTHGEYLGSIVGDRLVRRNDAHDARCAMHVPDPGPAEPPARAGHPLPFEHPFAYADVDLRRAC